MKTWRLFGTDKELCCVFNWRTSDRRAATLETAGAAKGGGRGPDGGDGGQNREWPAIAAGFFVGSPRLLLVVGLYGLLDFIG